LGLVSLEKDLALSPASLAKILLLSKILITKLSILQFLAILKINNKNMNCPNCKNPVLDNSNECEWCGSVLTSANKVYSLILSDAGRQKLGLVKLIKDLVGVNLKEARRIVDSKNSIVFTTEDFSNAEIIKNKLENCGASIVIK